MKKHVKKTFSKMGTLRHLPVNSADFQAQIREFEQWLRVFGFASSTIYYAPAYVGSFFFFLEKTGITEICKISNSNVKSFIRHLLHNNI